MSTETDAEALRVAKAIAPDVEALRKAWYDARRAANAAEVAYMGPYLDSLKEAPE
jgi:hypothetical protein